MNYPNEFLKNMEQMLGDEYPAFCRALLEPSVHSLRLNPIKPISFSGETVPWEPNGRYVDADFRPGKDLYHLAGAYYMQDASAMVPARALAPEPGDVVLDLCAAPGGKSGQLAAALMGLGVLVANEPDMRRAQALSGNLERLGVRNSVVTCALPQALSKVWGEVFDKILVDAPCSGEGMMRKDVAARDQWNPREVRGCRKRQNMILQEAAKMLKPGGLLAYSTCTFNDIENEGAVGEFLAAHPEFSPVDFSLPGLSPSKNGCLRLWPQKIRGEGHFVALLKKRGAAEKTKAVQDPSGQEAAEALRRFSEVARFDPEVLSNATPRFMGDCLTLLPNACPPIDGLRVLRAGLRLGEVRRDYLKPDHSLAMALKLHEATGVVALTTDEALSFAAGAPLSVPGKGGYALALYDGLPIGWGKRSGDTFKNHIPKGVRIR